MTDADILARLEALPEITSHGCVYEIYRQRQAATVEALIGTFPEAVRERAYVLAREHGHYDDVADVAEGDCVHGLDAMTCPCGCFE